MARLVTEKSVRAFLQHKNGKFGGICNNRYAGSAFGKVNTEIRDDVMYLFGHPIAKWVNGKIYFSMAGYNTATTRERLSGLGLPISSCQFVPYIRDEEISTSTWYPLEKFVRV